MNNVIVSPHYLSTDLASKIYEIGGNAVDAAIATNLIQGIVAPETCGIGGDLFALVWVPGESKPYFLDSSGYAGTNVNADELSGHNSIPLNHPFSVTVPGAVAGWHTLHKKFGSIPIEEILDIGIELCHNGFEISEELFQSLNHHKEELSGQASGYHFYRNDEPFKTGNLIRRVQLGKTLETLRDSGLMSFYNGEIADAISRSVSNVLTKNDLELFNSKWREPLHLNIFGYDGWTSPPSTQGYLTLSTLKLYELIGSSDVNYHQLIESYRILAADRDDITYDYKNHEDNFIGCDLDYLAEKVNLYNPNKSSIFETPKAHGGGTAYMNTVDKNGLAVSLIQSNFYGIGSRIGVEGYGFFLHNRGCGFNLIKGHPNYLQPHKKPLHTLSPTLWSQNNNLEFIIGTRGGRYQPQLLVQVILPYLLNKMSFEEIIKLPRWTIDYFTSETNSNLKFENINKSELDELTLLGHKIENLGELKKGNGPISIIYKEKNNLRFRGVCDIRVGTEKVFSSS